MAKVILANCLSGNCIANERGIEPEDIVYCNTYSELKSLVQLNDTLGGQRLVTDYFGILPENDLIHLFYTEQNLLAISKLGELAQMIVSLKEKTFGLDLGKDGVKKYAQSLLKPVSERSIPLAYLKKTPWVGLDDFLFMRCWRVLKGFSSIPFYIDDKTVVWQKETFYKRGYKNITKDYPISGFQFYSR